MKLRVILCAVFLLMLMGSASALANTTVDTLSGNYTGACAEISWTYTEATEADWDFNYWNITTTSDDTQHTGLDVNNVLITDRTHKICTLTDGDYITFTVTPVDNNITDFNYTNIRGAAASITVTGTSALTGGQFMVYSIFAAIASIIVLIILVFVVMMILGRMGISLPGLGGK